MTLAPGRVHSSSKVTVGIAEMAVSSTPGDVLITYALGSCLGICIYDPAAKVGGLLHAMLPSARTAPERAAINPERFVDTGVPALFKAAYKLGARKERILISVVGGASMGDPNATDSFQIGRRNYVALKKMLWKNGVVLKDHDVGGNVSRTVSLDLESGEVRVKSGRQEYTLSRTCPREPVNWME